VAAIHAVASAPAEVSETERMEAVSVCVAVDDANEDGLNGHTNNSPLSASSATTTMNCYES
jgi:hypothetical protein